MGKLERYIISGGKRLRCGYTTGTAAAGAVKAAAMMLLGGSPVTEVQLVTPANIPVTLDVEDICIHADAVSCAVRKDGGDDIDATDGIRIYAQVCRCAGNDVQILGGSGVGTVTRKGLDQPQGMPAINRGPRQMITDAVQAVCLSAGVSTGIQVVISAEHGEEIAQKTYNSRLGIVGGISILGTTGIVEPMSRRALVETIHKELDMLYAQSHGTILMTPGNYGERFSSEVLGLALSRAVICSNYIGEAVDYAVHLGFASILLVGHAGKLLKVAGGIFDTHSKVADARMEILCAHAAIAGGSAALCKKLMGCVTADEALDELDEAGLLEPVTQAVMGKIEEHLVRRAGETGIEAVVFTHPRGVVGMTSGAKNEIAQLKKEQL